MKKKLTIVCPSQFGYLIDTYYYARYLKESYDITFICIASQKPIIEEEGIKVIYIQLEKSGLFKWLEFSQKVKALLFEKKGMIFVKYFLFCSLLRTKLVKKNYILDIRTGAVTSKWLKRNVLNCILRFESSFAGKVNVISDSLARLLKLKKYCVVGLGSPEFTSEIKEFDSLRLLYVGVLSGRKIEDTIIGLKKYLDQTSNSLIEGYDVIGYGYGDEVNQLKKLVTKYNLDNIVKIHGRIPHNQLTPFLNNNNIGVSYVPKTSFFDVQPVTKTLEYIANGMFVIGTSTTEQKKVINQYNGVLCDDTPESFSEALSQIHNNNGIFNSQGIRDNTQVDTWEDIALKLQDILES